MTTPAKKIFTLIIGYDLKLSFATASAAANALTVLMGSTRTSNESYKDTEGEWHHVNVVSKKQFDDCEIKVDDAPISREEFEALRDAELADTTTDED